MTIINNHRHTESYFSYFLNAFCLDCVYKLFIHENVFWPYCRKEQAIAQLENELDQEKRMADNLVNDMVRQGY